MKTLLAFCFLILAFSLPAQQTNRTPLNRAFLQSDFDGNGRMATNFKTLRATNFIDAATGLPLSTGGGTTGGVTNNDTRALSFTNAGNIFAGDGSGLAGVAMSSNTAYASALGAKLNTSLISGGGNDDTAVLQKWLDRATNGWPTKLVMDGPALIGTNRPNFAFGYSNGTALTLHDNTTIECLPGAGFYLKTGSSCAMAGNMLNGTAITATNISIIGGTWNANGIGQGYHESELPNQGNKATATAHSNYVCGMWFAGVRGLKIDGAKVLNTRAYSILLNEAFDVDIVNWQCYWTTALGGGGGGNDGIHKIGNVGNLHVNGFRSNGSDDSFAFNLDEQEESDAAHLDPRWGHRGSWMTNILEENFDIRAPLNGGTLFRIQNFGIDPTATNAHMRNITIRNGVIDSGAWLQNVLSTSAYVDGDKFTVENVTADLEPYTGGSSLPSDQAAPCFSFGQNSDRWRSVNFRNITIRNHTTDDFAPTIYFAVAGVTNVTADGVMVSNDVMCDESNGPDYLFSVGNATGTNSPVVTLNNINVRNVNHVVGGGPSGRVRVSNVAMSTNSLVSSGTFTNLSGDGINGASGRTLVMAANGSAVWTNSADISITGNAATSTLATHLSNTDSNAILAQATNSFVMKSGDTMTGTLELQQINDSGNFVAFLVDSRIFRDTGGSAKSADMSLRRLYASDGSTVNLNWNTAGAITMNGVLTSNNIPGLSATNLVAGTVATARLGSGSATANTFLSGAQTYSSIPDAGLSANVALLNAVNSFTAANTMWGVTITNGNLVLTNTAAATGITFNTNGNITASGVFTNTGAVGIGGALRTGSITIPYSNPQNVISSGSGANGSTLLFRDSPLNIYAQRFDGTFMWDCSSVDFCVGGTIGGANAGSTSLARWAFPSAGNIQAQTNLQVLGTISSGLTITATNGFTSIISNASPVVTITLPANDANNATMWTNNFGASGVLAFQGATAARMDSGTISIAQTAWKQWPMMVTTAGSIPLRANETVSITNTFQPTLVTFKFAP